MYHLFRFSGCDDGTHIGQQGQSKHNIHGRISVVGRVEARKGKSSKILGPLWACLVRWFRTNMHRGVQSRSVWLAGGALEPGWPHAGSAVGPGSGETPESAVSAGPGSLGAAVYSTNDVLVYD